ncbi:MAG: alpha/beta hydrolase, partial [Deltaproteobacteria bacterium]
MRKMFLLALAIFIMCMLVGPAVAEKPYFFPYVNPYEATVMEVPAVYEADLPKQVPTKVFRIHPFPDRKTPKVFW